MEQREFEIEARPGLKFRTAFKSGLEVLSFRMTMDFTDADKLTKAMAWSFERVEVLVLNNWLPLKEKGYEVFNPADIGDDVEALQEIFLKMLSLIKDVFQQSRGSSQKQQ